MKENKNKISILAVRNANGRLVAKAGKSTHIVSDNSRNGIVAFRAVFGGKSFDLNITRANIKTAYAKSRAKTIL